MLIRKVEKILRKKANKSKTLQLPFVVNAGNTKEMSMSFRSL